MNTKLIIAAAALAISIGSASTFAMADAVADAAINDLENLVCTANSNCPPPPKALGRTYAPKALGRTYAPKVLGRTHAPIVLPANTPEPQICAKARISIAAQRPTAAAMAKRCADLGGNAYGQPPVIISAPAPTPAPQPSGSAIDANVDPGDYENNNHYGISCGEGRSIVRHSGFRKVHAMDCSSDVFTYSAKKHDQLFKVYVNAKGYIVHVSNLSL